MDLDGRGLQPACNLGLRCGCLVGCIEGETAYYYEIDFETRRTYRLKGLKGWISLSAMFTPMWSRYNQSSSESWPQSASDGGVTPFSRYPLQDGFYNTMAYTHVAIGFTYLSLTLWQFLAQKGTPEHVQRGRVLKWIALGCIGGGWLLQIRHSWFSDPKVFEKHPVPRQGGQGTRCFALKGV